MYNGFMLYKKKWKQCYGCDAWVIAFKCEHETCGRCYFSGWICHCFYEFNYQKTAWRYKTKHKEVKPKTPKTKQLKLFNDDKTD